MSPKNIYQYGIAIVLLSFFWGCSPYSRLADNLPSESEVGEGWAKNSVNTVIFRKNSLTSNRDYQFISYYDEDQYVVIGRRKLGQKKWQLHRTQYKADVRDAHRSISIMLDGDGFLHLSFDHHDNKLHYAKSIAPLSLEIGDFTSMIGVDEEKISYPEFYYLPNGDLIFLCRNGQSGNGNLLINHYITKEKKWTRVQNLLIDGEGERSAYLQSHTDNAGGLHISWVWRESPNVSSNHDLMYAYSPDFGKTWKKSTGEIYTLPITQSNAEVIAKIPEKSELINQTSITTNVLNQPFIVSYWREQASTVPQYHLIFKDKDEWQIRNLNFRKTPFSLSGGGTKLIPISRPQLVIGQNNKAFVIFRDQERQNKISIAANQFPYNTDWKVTDLDNGDYSAWEPTLDTELWREEKILSLFVQKTFQVDGEGLSTEKSSKVKVLDVKLK